MSEVKDVRRRRAGGRTIAGYILLGGVGKSSVKYISVGVYIVQISSIHRIYKKA